MPITPPPSPPNRNNPATFSDDADAFLAWFPDFVDEYNADAALMGRRYVTYGGTANAITLTGALPAGATVIPTGTQVRFRASAANTGATTINLDGVGAIACRTVTGAVLPSGYIRTDEDTSATYNGTYWILDRQVERGTNANGFWWRWADGKQVCVNNISHTDGSATATGQVFWAAAATTWTYPIAFSSSPDWGEANPNISAEALRSDRAAGIVVAARSNSSINFRPWTSTSLAAGGTINCILRAEGHWY